MTERREEAVSFPIPSPAAENLQICELCDNKKRKFSSFSIKSSRNWRRKNLLNLQVEVSIKTLIEINVNSKFSLPLLRASLLKNAEIVEKIYSLFAIRHHDCENVHRLSLLLWKNETLFNWKYTHLKVHHRLSGGCVAKKHPYQH